MLVFEGFEIRWRGDAGPATLTIDAAGSARLYGPSGSDPGAAAASKEATSPRAGFGKGRRWTEVEEADLTRDYGDGVSVAGLARAHGRSEGAIRSRLVRLGLLEEAVAGLRFPVARPERGG